MSGSLNPQQLVRRLAKRPLSKGTLILTAAIFWAGCLTAAEIHDAAKDGDLEKVRGLLRASPDLVFSKDEEGATALLIAARTGHADIVAFLLANAADVNTQGKDEKLGKPDRYVIKLSGTPLHSAVLGSDKEMVKLLLANQANVNIRDGIGQTPLHDAALTGNKEITELLVRHGGDGIR